MNSWISIVIYIVFLIGLYYVLVFLPRKMQDKKHREMMQNLRPGDRVMTVGGMYGEVARVSEETVFLRVSGNVEIEFAVRSISGKVEEKKAE